MAAAPLETILAWVSVTALNKKLLFMVHSLGKRNCPQQKPCSIHCCLWCILLGLLVWWYVTVVVVSWRRYNGGRMVNELLKTYMLGGLGRMTSNLKNRDVTQII